MITLTEPWDCGYMTFPIGTVFIPQHRSVPYRGRKGTIYTYASSGVSGEIFVDKGNTPGVQLAR